MEKTKRNEGLRRYKRIFATCLVFQFIFSGLLYAAIDLHAQTVTETFKNTKLNNVIWELQRQTDFTFIHRSSEVKGVKEDEGKAKKER